MTLSWLLLGANLSRHLELSTENQPIDSEYLKTWLAQWSLERSSGDPRKVCRRVL
jgi:hypothetical protein